MKEQCPVCHNVHSRQVKFCTRCGYALKSGVINLVTAPKIRSPKRENLFVRVLSTLLVVVGLNMSLNSTGASLVCVPGDCNGCPGPDC